MSEGPGPVQQNTPSFAELAAALKSLQQPVPVAEKPGLERHITTIIVAASLGIGAWVLSGLNSVQTTLSRVDATMTAVQTTVQDTSRRVDALTSGQAEAKAQQAILASRVDALEKREPRR